jgi:hypothetical protein
LNYVYLRLEVIWHYTLRLEKRHIAFILLILFGLNQSASWYYAAQIHQHRQAERKSKHRNAFFTFSYSQFQKAKRMAEDEILIDGKMFDIKSITFEDDAVVLYGHFDQKEDQLLAMSDKAEEKKNQSKKVDGFDFTLFNIITEYQNLLCKLNYVETQFPRINHNIVLQFYDVESPPPKYAGILV